MKTDYEFIKNKFDESDVKAPESMNEEFVLDKIKDVKPKKNRKPLVATLSTAAAVAVITAVAIAVTSIFGSTPQPIKIAGTKARLTNFKSADDVKEAIRTINKQSQEANSDKGNYAVAEDAADAAGDNSLSYQKNFSTATGGAASKSADAGHNATYTQYTNVDEADTVKTDGKYIFYRANASSITVFLAKGKSSKKIAEIMPTKVKKADDVYFEDFYVYNNKLLAVEGTMYSHTFNNTKVELFDISDINNIKSTDSFTQSGTYCSSRMIGSMMYIVSNHYASKDTDLPKAGKSKAATDDETTPNEISCTDIYTVEKPSTPNFLVVSGIDTDNGAQATKTKAILGSADTVYCNTEHLFVTAAEYEFSSNKYEDFYWFGSAATYTQIVKVDLNNNLDFTATTKVKGYIDNQYALDEKDGNLRVAVTYNTDMKKANKETNRLCILNKNLKEVGKTPEFAKGESIKAVRYIGNTAYVITYEQTDPLFVIDTADARKPKILGEVKISGFSTMLVPVDDNTLLGIGYHTQDEDDDIDMEIQEGVKLALFDVTDKANPKVLDEKIFKNYESEVQYNPKALLVNFERNDYTIPYTHYYDDDEDTETECGIINFKVDNKKLSIIDEYKSKKFNAKDIDNSCELERCAYVSDYIYMLGSYYNYDDDDSYAIIDAVKYRQ